MIKSGLSDNLLSHYFERAINQITSLVTTLHKHSEDYAVRGQKIYSLRITVVRLVSSPLAQEPAKKNKYQPVIPAATRSAGSKPGRLLKLASVSGASTDLLGDTNIFEDEYIKVGSGTISPTSLLTSQG